MAWQQIGPDHNIGGVIHTQIFRDDQATDPAKAFKAKINGPNFSEDFAIANGASVDYPLPVAGGHSVHVEVDNYNLLPGGSTPQNATALSFLLVFRVRIGGIINITVGSVPVTASLK